MFVFCYFTVFTWFKQLEKVGKMAQAPRQQQNKDEVIKRLELQLQGQHIHNKNLLNSNRQLSNENRKLRRGLKFLESENISAKIELSILLNIFYSILRVFMFILFIFLFFHSLCIAYSFIGGTRLDGELDGGELNDVLKKAESHVFKNMDFNNYRDKLMEECDNAKDSDDEDGTSIDISDGDEDINGDNNTTNFSDETKQDKYKSGSKSNPVNLATPPQSRKSGKSKNVSRPRSFEMAQNNGSPAVSSLVNVDKQEKEKEKQDYEKWERENRAHPNQYR